MANPVLFLAQLNGSLAFQDRAGGGTLTGSGAVRYAPAEGALVNYVHNGSFETGISGWATYTGSGSVASRVHETSESYQGTKSQRLDLTSISGGVGVSLASSSFAPTNGGQQWSAGVWVKTTPGVTVKLYIFAYNAAGTYLGNNPSPPVSTGSGSWEYLTATWAVPAGASRVGIGVYHAGGSVPCSIWTDAAILCPGTSVPTFFDGSTGGVWLNPITGILGTAHASPSVSQAVAWVEEGTTNAITNPSFETNTTNWAAVNSATLTRVSTYAYGGSYSLQIVTGNLTTAEGATFARNVVAAANGQSWTGQLRYRGTGTWSFRVQEYDSGSGFLAESSSGTLTAGDTWSSVNLSRTLNNASTAYVTVTIYTTSQQSATLYIDWAQLEQKAYATSYTDGSLGTGYAWSGTAHASSSTRTATSVTVAKETRMSNVRGSGAAIFQRAYDSAVSQYLFGAGAQNTVSEDWIGLRIGQGSPDALICSVSHSNTGIVNGTASGSASALLTRIFGYGQWEAASVGAAVSTDAVVTAVVANPPVGWTAVIPLSIGSNANTLHLNGYIGPVLIADRPLTAKERATLNARTSWGWSTLKGGKPGLLLPT